MNTGKKKEQQELNVVIVSMVVFKEQRKEIDDPETLFF